MPRRTERTPEEILAQDIKGMGDSKILVEQLVDAEVTAQQDLDTIYRNYRHLEIMLQRDNIAASDLDAAPYQLVIDEAVAYLEAQAYVQA
jgi:hypothetical protein